LPPQTSRDAANIDLAQEVDREGNMAESVYKVVEIVGTSTESWEKAAKAAVDRAAKTLKDLRIAEVVQSDIQLKNGKIEAYRTRLKLSFKYRDKD
jgi:dodecin